MNQIMHRIELALWDQLIPMLSNSIMVRQAVRTGYQVFYEKIDVIQGAMVIGLSGAIGVVVGLIILKVTTLIS